MDLSDVAGYMERDWAAVAALKELHWVERVKLLGPAESLRIADELRRQVVAARPGWPSAAERLSDLESHQRLSELLSRADPARSR